MTFWLGFAVGAVSSITFEMLILAGFFLRGVRRGMKTSR